MGSLAHRSEQAVQLVEVERDLADMAVAVVEGEGRVEVGKWVAEHREHHIHTEVAESGQMPI